MDRETYEKIVDKILSSIEEGVHVIDQGGNPLFYNRAMAQMEKMEQADVLGKPFHEVFKNISKTESTLLQALEYGKTTVSTKQTYFNKDGKKITSVNTTIPVINRGKIIAAIEIAKNITEIEKMSNAILDLQQKTLEPENRYRPIKRYNFENLIGENDAFNKVIETAKKAAHTSASVVIFGETGTGKELIAQSIHYGGVRKNKPFLAQNCAALPESLLEGILFGTSKGGFTGAIDRAGLFEQADGGTLLLDEINTMPYELQGKLLRVLQEDYIRRVGGTKDIPIDVRIIATMNEKAEDLIASGKLRKDLYYRLNIIGIYMVPLRDRKDDIVLLAEKFIEKYNDKYKKQVAGLTHEAKEKLYFYDYPGNVRELENLIMAAVSMAENNEALTEKHILIHDSHEDCYSGKPGYQFQEAVREYDYDEEEIGLDEFLNRKEEELIRKALKRTEGNISQAANYLKIKRQTLQHKMKKFKL